MRASIFPLWKFKNELSEVHHGEVKISFVEDETYVLA